MYTKDKFKNNEELVIYYTWLADFNALNALFDLEKLDTATKRGKLNPFEMLFLCLMRLRLGLVNRLQECKTTISKVFLLVLNVLYVKLTPVIIWWPERSELIASMPICFRAKFGTKIKTIIDCSELYIERPTYLTARSLTWSYHKNSNTVKYLIGITPQGTICFISKGWGGRTSDQHVIQNSGFFKYLIYGDTVMADRGFNIAETVGTYRARLEIPSFTKRKEQLREEEIESTRMIANVQIYVERVIGNLLKKYSLLDQTLPIDCLITEKDKKVPTLDKLVHIACVLTNMCPSVVPMD